MSIIKSVFIAAGGAALAAADTTRPTQTYGRFTVPHAEDLGLPSWALPEVTDKEGVMKFGLWIRAETKPKEQTLLLTLLNGGDRDPAAVNLLKELIAAKDSGKKRSGGGAKERRMTSTDHHCGLQLWEAACVVETGDDCVPCTWNSVAETCGIAECRNYVDQTTCCGNADGVVSGCFWDSVSTMCVDMKCNVISDSTVCAEHLNCKWTGTACGCIDAPSTCEGGMENEPADPVVDMGCPPLDCAMCLKSSGNGDSQSIDYQGQDRALSCTEMKASAQGIGMCAVRCKDAAHCDGEVECLMHMTKNMDPCMKYACAAGGGPVQPVHPSCDAGKTVTTSTTTVADYSDCDDSQCEEVEKVCGSCGKEACQTRKEAQEAAVVLLHSAIVSSICICIGCCVFCYIKAGKKKQAS